MVDDNDAGRDRRLDSANPIRRDAATERFRRHIGSRAEARPRPSLAGAIAAGAGVVGGAGVVVLGGEILADDGSRLAAVLLAGAYGCVAMWMLVRPDPVVQSAGVAALIVAVPAAVGFVVIEQRISANDPAVVLAVSSVAWAFFHVVGSSRGHPVFLAAALIGSWLTVIVRLDPDAVLDPLGGRGVAVGDGTAATLASFGFASVYLLVAYAVDAAGLRGTATPFTAAGVLAIAVGVLQVADGEADGAAAAALLGAGAVVAVLGSLRRRRGSIWIGAAGFTLGIGVTIHALSGADQQVAAGLSALGTATLLVACAPGLARVLGEIPTSSGIPERP